MFWTSGTLGVDPFHVLTSSCPGNETQLAIASGAKVLHDVGSFQLYPFMELGILQKSSMTFNFANYSY